jgi:NAD(P)H dehydrogenase (quinone)
MEKVKVAVVYYSSTGGNYQLAKWAVDGAEAAGAEVKLFRVRELAPPEAVAENPLWKENLEATKDIPEPTPEDLVEADAIIWSSPTRYGVMAAQMKQFIDTLGGVWSQGLLVDKVMSAMSSAMNMNGGVEQTVMGFITVFFHLGAIVVGPGYIDPSSYASGGNPYGVSAKVIDGEIMNDPESAVKFQARRTVEVAARLKGIEPVPQKVNPL